MRQSEFGNSLSRISVEPEWLLNTNADSRSDAVFNDIDLELGGEGYDHPIEPRVAEKCMVITKDPWGVPTDSSFPSSFKIPFCDPNNRDSRYSDSRVQVRRRMTTSADEADA